MNLWKHYAKWNKRDTKGQMLHDSTYEKYLEYLGKFIKHKAD